MKIRHQDIEICEQDPFSNCKLDRKQYALILTDIVRAYADGFVLAINNEWGTGKTTFVKMWQQHLINKGFSTLYFNAWENDFDSNPLTAIMSELKTLTNKKNKAIFKSVVEKGAVLAKNIVPSLAKSLAKQYLGGLDEVVIDTIKNTTKGATEILEEEIKDYTRKKGTVKEFREELEKFIRETDQERPLVFFIDELDRCRPTYAVEVLEQMKHFFSVPGIVFVLSIDKKHLASAVRGFYGSEQINTDEYLRRFIDLEYSIPDPSTDAFSKYLFDYYSFKDFFFSPERNQNNRSTEDAELLLQMAGLLFEKSNATLRQQEKIFGQTRLILTAFRPNQETFSYLLFVLIYIKNMKSDIYAKIERHVFSLQELSEAFENIMPSEIKNRYGLNLIYIEALLLYLYNDSLGDDVRKELFEMNDIKVPITFINSKLEGGSNDLARYFASFSRNLGFRRLNLDYLLEKIDLTDPLLIQ